MIVKGKALDSKKELDNVFQFLKMQIKYYHNSNPFKVKGVGEASGQNIEYFLERAKQELNIYFVKKYEVNIK